MPRDRTLVSDDERDNALVEIVEFAKDVNIKLSKKNWGKNYVQKDDTKTNGYYIVLARPTVKGVESWTALNHECCHLLFDSPISEALDIFAYWIRDKPAEHRAFYTRVYKHMWNILEDQRIEYLGGKLWVGTGRRFFKMRKKIGEMKREETEDPLKLTPPDLILMCRFLQGDYVKENKYYGVINQALDDVEGTGTYGAIIVLKNIKSIIDYWLRDYMNEIKDEPHTSTRWSGMSHLKKSPWWSKKATQDDIDRKDDHHKWQNPDSSSAIKSTPQNVWDVIKNDDVSDDIIQEEINNSKHDGNNDIDNLRNAITALNSVKKDNDKFVEHGERESSDDKILIEKEILTGLKMVFKALAERPKTRITSEGYEVDIESYIERKITKKDRTKCLKDKKNENGISLLISIDGSSSMGEQDNMSKARRFVRTLFTATKHIDNVEIKAQVWSSNSSGIVWVTDINSINDCNQITTGVQKGFYNLTPTHKAIMLASKTAKHMQGNKKLVIMITDGIPNYAKRGFLIPRATVEKMAKNAFTKSLRVTPNFMCILLGRSHPHTNLIMRNIFGEKRFMRVDNFSEASERIIRDFKQLTIRVLK